MALNITQVLPFITAQQPVITPNSAPIITLLQFNLCCPHNDDHQRIIDFINRRQPDLVVFSEVNQSWKQAIETGLIDYPYRKVQATDDGVALFSRLPLSDIQVKFFGPTQRPRLQAVVEKGEKRILIIAAHPIVPKWLTIRNAEFDAIARDARMSSLPVVVAGDMNCTQFSFYWDKFLSDSGLHDSQLGYGIQPSWPSEFPFTPFLPLDHYLLSDELTSVRNQTGPFIGSDHLPVYVEIAISAQPSRLDADKDAGAPRTYSSLLVARPFY